MKMSVTIYLNRKDKIVFPGTAPVPGNTIFVISFLYDFLIGFSIVIDLTINYIFAACIA